jgi:hypothetical protein
MGKEPLATIKQESGWAPELVWKFWRKENLLPPPVLKPQPVTIPKTLSWLLDSMQ